MKAAWYEQLGAAREVLTVNDMAASGVEAGEVLVKVYASGVNPSDVKQRGGWGGLKMRAARVIPHNDGAGIIEAVGQGVSPQRIGQRVWLYKATFARAMGTAAEYVTIPAQQAVELPDPVSFAIGASLGVPAMTAHHCIFKDGSVQGQTLLVTGGAGAVGHYAIQLAKWGGAQVITTVSSMAKAETAQAAGADQVINYKTESVVERVREITQQKAGIDRVIEVDFAGNLDSNLALLKLDGVIAAYASDSNREPPLPFYGFASKNLTIHTVLVYAMSDTAHSHAITDITACLEAGILQPNIAQQFPLDEIAAAHEMQESGEAIGKILIELAS
ncbi:MAG: NADPH:quinone reductase [Pegethrix bostrychoides GSE-TBD4-15B]|jgi:NADPH2:quinone reductase|uniref:NADPH:quinone reductase n=1 Tax=Pegethrix bostrychoides GSE-TBD4-15B TaxID=2839662 RepID=A0A951PCW7_9CYAN|nr:NADPH:quinone reductase [Pegethrix bostrychoides GSE-TBD4-15B]